MKSYLKNILRVQNNKLLLTSILAQWRHYPRLKEQCEKNVCRPLGSAWKPPLPQYATTLYASGEIGRGKNPKITVKSEFINI
jgi:hypothetical protein